MIGLGSAEAFQPALAVFGIVRPDHRILHMRLFTAHVPFSLLD
jgi:hypothetical protein